MEAGGTWGNRWQNTNHTIFMLCIEQLCSYCPAPVSEGSDFIWGIPGGVHSDKGGENVDDIVWRFMMHIHGSPSVVIAGSSTHNERIERLWRDLFCCVSGHYYELFYKLEEQELLNPLNENRSLLSSLRLPS